MSKLRVKNFGPIKDGLKSNQGWIEFKGVTAFIGNQGTGKSTIAKLFSTLTWLEKAINRGDIDLGQISFAAFSEFFDYQRIENYFRPETEFEYAGDRMYLKYSRELNYPTIEMNLNDQYEVPKIMYVPAERNFLSAVRNAYRIKNLPDTLHSFAEELRKGQYEIGLNLLDLPFGGLKYKFKEETETAYLVGKDYELDVSESSSGYQSIIPLFLVTKFLAEELQKGTSVLREQLDVEQSVRRNKEITDIIFNNTISEEEKDRKIKEIDAKYLNTCFINIVEEPEQNLFPSSQKAMLDTLVFYNNRSKANKLVLTTHSPYLINYISISVEANALLKKNPEVSRKFRGIISPEATIAPETLTIYEMDEFGAITLLPSYEGIPTDENTLNEKLIEGNDMFSNLIALENNK